jgi:hypothetical protein
MPMRIDALLIAALALTSSGYHNKTHTHSSHSTYIGT